VFLSYIACLQIPQPSSTSLPFFCSLKTAFFAVGCLMVVASALQLSLVSERELSNLFSRVDKAQGRVIRQARSLSFTVKDILQERVGRRRASMCSESSTGDISDTSVLFDDISSFVFADDADAAKQKED